MSNHCGKNRYLRPVNFNKEVYLDVNLGPLHMCDKLVEEMYKRCRKEYIFKERDDGRLMYGHKLVDERLGSAIRTFRQKDEKKAGFLTSSGRTLRKNEEVMSYVIGSPYCSC